MPALAVGRTGAGAAVAFVDDGGDLRVSRLEGATWTTELVHDAAGITGDVSLAFDAGGGLHVAFVESGVLRGAARPSGARGWEGPIVVGDGASAPVLRAGGATIHLVWLRTDPSGSAVVAARRR